MASYADGQVTLLSARLEGLQNEVHEGVSVKPATANPVSSQPEAF